ncbi:hypothetical protein P6F26_01140 [Roseibacterium sp. SDUM158017]|uniref:hypothetical protein n=1 Tax=Roseicyclus salinarum TaxID=3036773 RepID=UPI00241573CB|nr:hypothetical protein [Roseibacterium sp. SDUM158017]MDG4647036.1 hypothetical protein [Roseibacterium sp. SDUM158017]
MTRQRTLARMTSAGILSCGLAIYAAQAGMLPGIELGVRPQDEARPTATTGAFARAHGHQLPPGSGFAAAPTPEAAAPAVPRIEAVVRPAALAPELAPPAPRSTAATDARTFSRFGLPCGLEVSAKAGTAAMIAVDISAPCHPDADVTLRHAGIAISARTDAFGLLTLDLPALESPAIVAVELADGTERTAMLPVSDLAGFDRIALAWEGELDMELHALEDGAAWASDGHVRPAAPRGPEAASEGRGFLSLLGDPRASVPLLAQVYTIPRGTRAASGVTLSIDAPITAANCALQATARIVQAEGGRIAMTPLGFTYPGCDAVGDTLVLQNPVQDLRLAAN